MGAGMGGGGPLERRKEVEWPDLEVTSKEGKEDREVIEEDWGEEGAGLEHQQMGEVVPRTLEREE